MLEQVPDAVRSALSARTPFPPRAGTPEDFAAFVLHVIENRMVNGGTVRLDGALRMG